MAASLAHTCSILLQCSFFLLACYYFAISLFSLFPRKPLKSIDEKNRFAIIIPAHNEENCLPGLLKTLKQQTYPKELFSIFVVADQCTDKTYDIAAFYHATPLLRKTNDYSGKGAVLSDAFTQIMAIPIHFDAFVILDADNHVDSRFLEEINHTMQQGNQAVQGYIDSKNPNESWLSHAYSTWYWLSNRLIQMGYDKLGFGCKLGGTGFALSRTLLEQIPWKTTTMAEDAEYTIQMSLQNQRVAYAPKAVVYDEKPSVFSTSIRQRIRWTQGMTQVQRDLCWKLLKQGKWNAFLRFWSDFLLPLCFTLFCTLNIFSITNLLDLTQMSFVDLWTKPVPFLLLTLYLWGTVAIAIFGLFLDKKWNHKIILNLFGSFLYLISWIPAGFFGVLRHHQKDWYHTKHRSEI